MKIASKIEYEESRWPRKRNLEALVRRINAGRFTCDLIEVGPNVIRSVDDPGIYYITNESGQVEGAIQIINTRDVLTYGLLKKHFEPIKTTVIPDAIEVRGIYPLKTINGSMPKRLRDQLGFEGPYEDTFTKDKYWELM